MAKFKQMTSTYLPRKTTENIYNTGPRPVTQPVCLVVCIRNAPSLVHNQILSISVSTDLEYQHFCLGILFWCHDLLPPLF